MPSAGYLRQRTKCPPYTPSPKGHLSRSHRRCQASKSTCGQRGASSRTQRKLAQGGVRAGRASMRGARCVRAALSGARLPNPINELYPARWGRAHMLARSPGVAPQRRQSPLCAIYDSPLGAKKGTSHQ